MPKLPYEPRRAAGLSVRTILALILFAVAAVLSLAAAPQNPPIPPPPTPQPRYSTGPTNNSNSASSPTSNSNDRAQDQSVETLKVNVEVVQLFFNVKDKHGALIPNLENAAARKSPRA